MTSISAFGEIVSSHVQLLERSYQIRQSNVFFNLPSRPSLNKISIFMRFFVDRGVRVVVAFFLLLTGSNVCPRLQAVYLDIYIYFFFFIPLTPRITITSMSSIMWLVVMQC